MCDGLSLRKKRESSVAPLSRIGVALRLLLSGAREVKHITDHCPLTRSCAPSFARAPSVLLARVAAGAQSFQGGLRGTVKDAQGVIPGVTVTLVNEATGATRETMTNSVGEYSFPAVDPARYTLRAEVQGFKPFEQPERASARSSSSASTSCSRSARSKRRSPSPATRR